MRFNALQAIWASSQARRAAQEAAAAREALRAHVASTADLMRFRDQAWRLTEEFRAAQGEFHRLSQLRGAEGEV